MHEVAPATSKKIQYRISEFVGNIAAARLTDEKTSLATQLGISISQLNRLIRGESEPSGTQLRIIADFFGVQVDELYASEEIEY